MEVLDGFGNRWTGFCAICRIFVFVELWESARYSGLTYKKASASPGREGTPNFSMSRYLVVRST